MVVNRRAHKNSERVVQLPRQTVGQPLAYLSCIRVDVCLRERGQDRVLVGKY